jgi:hypothetical protein
MEFISNMTRRYVEIRINRICSGGSRRHSFEVPLIPELLFCRDGSRSVGRNDVVNVEVLEELE